MLLAIDFDGTIVQNAWREPYNAVIGEEVTGAITTLKRLKKEGHKLILWTGRTGWDLISAVNWCKERGLEFDAINTNIADVRGYGCVPKIYADVYIDDRGIGLAGLKINWGIIYRRLREIDRDLEVRYEGDFKTNTKETAPKMQD